MLTKEKLVWYKLKGIKSEKVVLSIHDNLFADFIVSGFYLSRFSKLVNYQKYSMDDFINHIIETIEDEHKLTNLFNNHNTSIIYADETLCYYPLLMDQKNIKQELENILEGMLWDGDTDNT